MKKRNILICLLLSIVTLGIYDIFWAIDLIYETDKFSKDKNNGPIAKIVYSLITCGIYSCFWAYRVGKNLYDALKEKRAKAFDKSWIYVVLLIFEVITLFSSLDYNVEYKILLKDNFYLHIAFGFPSVLIIMASVQNDLNKLV